MSAARRRALLPVVGVLLLAVAAPARALDAPPYVSKVEPLSASQAAQLRPRFWRPGCPVPLEQLRVLTVAHWDFAGERRLGQLVVNEDAARPLASAFDRLYELRFPIRHMRFADLYGPRPKPTDVSGAFACRESVPSPCSGRTRSGTWSQHAYGRAVDLNPVENPYFGPACGKVHDPRSRRFLDRSRLRRGMVTPAVVRAFASIGWRWGGAWRSTRDYMHFSATGR